ncbi:MAG: AAA family ATPase [Nanoarchaeota archaeon]|nr:AAA family ATPase [Nanoarchaeota archaeon]
MSDSWYRKLGFSSNPFNIKPAAFQGELVAYDVDFIYSKIDSGEMVFIEGQYGTGKTTILKSIINRYKGKNKIIYYSFNEGESVFNLASLLDGANSLIRKITGVKEKNIILLLDEVHTMKQHDAKKIIAPYKKGIVKSVVFVSHDFDMVKFPEDVLELLNGNVIRTVNLSTKEAVELVRRRIGDIDLFSDRTISRLFMQAEKNPRKLLEYCEDVARHAVMMGDSIVTDKHIVDVLGEYKPAERKPVPAVQTQTAPLPVIEAPRPRPAPAQAVKVEEAAKKFKINKLVGGEKKNTLGAIIENPPESDNKEEPEYKVYFLDKN